MGKWQIKLKVLASALAVSFLGQQIALAAPLAARPMVEMPLSIPQLVLPASVAVVEDSYRVPKTGSGRAERLVVLIQDAHTNESAQSNLAASLATILPKQHIRTVFTEAAEGDVSLDLFKSRYSAQVREAVGRKLMRAGILKGAEYLSLTSDQEFRIWGVEDISLYKKALADYKHAASRREKALAYLDRLSRAADALKADIYSAPLRAFDARATKYLVGDIGLTDHFDALYAEAKQLALPMDLYPELRSLDRLKRLEQNIDFKAAVDEQKQAVASLSAEARQELEEAARAPHAPGKVRSGSDGYDRAYFMLLQEKLNNAAARYPQLKNYFAYLKESQALQTSKVLSEFKALEEQVYGRLAVTEDEKRLLAVARNLRTIKDLVALKCSPDDFRTTLENPAAFDLRAISGYINRKIMDLDRHYDLITTLDPVAVKAEKIAREFYALALRRDQVFVERMLGSMEAAAQDHAALVIGGFHADNIKDLLRQEGVSYISVIPQVLHETDNARYEKILFEGSQEEAVQKIRRAPASGAANGLMTAPVSLALVESALADAAGTAASTADELTGARLAASSASALKPVLGARMSSRPVYSKALYEGVGETEDEWAVREYLIDLFLRPGITEIGLVDLLRAAEKTRTNADRAQRLLEGLTAIRILERTATGSYKLAVEPEVAAVKFNGVYFIRDQFAAALNPASADPKEAAQNVRQLIERYERITDLWFQAPIEARWPVIKGSELLEAKDQDSLLALLAGDLKDLADFTATGDSLRLEGARSESKADDWVTHHAKELEGRSVYGISPEIHLAAGGLGRVMQYHLTSMKRLTGDHVRIRSVEPKYSAVRVRDPFTHGYEDRPLDYGSSAMQLPLHNLEQIARVPILLSGGRKVWTRIFRTVNPDGVTAFMVEDEGIETSDDQGAVIKRFTSLLYKYGSDYNGVDAAGRRWVAADWQDFAEFFSRVSLVTAALAEQEIWIKDPGQYRGAVLHVNDSQCGYLPTFFRSDDLQSARSEGDQLLFDPAFLEAFKTKSQIVASTHTYANRVRENRQSGVVRRIAKMFERFFATLFDNDIASGMLRLADRAFGVSLVHVSEVGPIDPGVFVSATTNGDDLAKSNRVFNLNLVKANPGIKDILRPTEEEIVRAKQYSKNLLRINFSDPSDALSREALAFAKQLNPAIDTADLDQVADARTRAAVTKLQSLNPDIRRLDPNKFTFGFTGRYVPEKNGRVGGPFSDENLWSYADQPIQAIIAGNVQFNTDPDHDRLKATARSINDQRKAGLVLAIDGWGQEEQAVLLAAEDAQVQPSTRHKREGAKSVGTEAAGYSESHAGANAAVQIAPAALEGILGTQGKISFVDDMDGDRPGNTFAPSESTARGYGSLVRELAKHYTENPIKFARHQAVSRRLSRALNADRTAAEYLRTYADDRRYMDNPELILQEALAGDQVAAALLRGQWVRRRLAAALRSLGRQLPTDRVVNNENFDGVEAFWIEADPARQPGKKYLVMIDLGMRNGEGDIEATRGRLLAGEPWNAVLADISVGGTPASVAIKDVLATLASGKPVTYETYTLGADPGRDIRNGLPFMVADNSGNDAGVQVLELVAQRPAGARLADSATAAPVLTDATRQTVLIRFALSLLRQTGTPEAAILTGGDLSSPQIGIVQASVRDNRLALTIGDEALLDLPLADARAAVRAGLPVAGDEDDFVGTLLASMRDAQALPLFQAQPIEGKYRFQMDQIVPADFSASQKEVIVRLFVAVLQWTHRQKAGQKLEFYMTGVETLGAPTREYLTGLAARESWLKLTEVPIDYKGVVVNVHSDEASNRKGEVNLRIEPVAADRMPDFVRAIFLPLQAVRSVSDTDAVSSQELRAAFAALQTLGPAEYERLKPWIVRGDGGEFGPVDMLQLFQGLKPWTNTMLRPIRVSRLFEGARMALWAVQTSA